MDEEESNTGDQDAIPREDGETGPDDRRIKHLYAKKLRVEDSSDTWDFHEIVILLAWLATGFVTTTLSLRYFL